MEKTPVVKVLGLELLESIASTKADQEPMFAMDGIVTAARRAAANGETPRVEEIGPIASAHLASAAVNKKPMFKVGGVVAAGNQGCSARPERLSTSSWLG